MKHLALALVDRTLLQTHKALSALLLLSTACGARSEVDTWATNVGGSSNLGGNVAMGATSAIGGSPGGGGAAGAAPVACPVCAHPWFDCSASGREGANFQVESQNPTGCDGHIVQVGIPTTPYSIICDPPQACSGQQCDPVSLTTNSFSWSTGATCLATTN